jgi:hypothetical protein
MRAAVWMVMAGCSFSMARPPATDPGTRPLECSQSRASPIADVVGAVVFSSLGLLGAAYAVDYYGSSMTGFAPSGGYGVGFALVGGAAGALYIVSAARGFDSAFRCEQLNQHAVGSGGF